MNFTRFCLLIIFMASFIYTNAQPDTDSLKKVLPTMREDTNKVKAMYHLSEVITPHDPGEGTQWAIRSEQLAKKLGWETGRANALLSVGTAYQSLSKFDDAKKSYLTAQATFERTNNTAGIAKTKNAIGKMYLVQGNYAEALKNSMEGLKLAEEVKDEVLQAQASSNIGGIYFRQGKNKDALSYFTKALQLFDKSGQKKGAALALSNIGAIRLGEGKIDTALFYLKKALKLNEEAGSTDAAGMNIANIAGAYMMQGKYNESLVYSFKSLRINQTTGDANNVAIDLLNIGETYLRIATGGAPIVADSLVPIGKTAVLAKAIQFMNDAERELIRVGGDINALGETHRLLSEAYEASGNTAMALQHFKTYKILQDSVFSTDNRLTIADQTTKRANHEKEQQIEINRLQKIKSRNETIAWIAGVGLLLIVTFFVARERRRSEKLLLNILPEEVAKELKKHGGSEAKYFDEVTVLFTDFVNFTVLSEKLSPQALVDELHTCFKAFDEITSRHRIEKIKTVGDAYLAIGGLPTVDPDHAYNVVMAAKDIVSFMKQRYEELGSKTFEVRVGVHSGSVVAGIVGVKKFAYDIWGDTVNIAARMEQNSLPGRINISKVTHDLIADRINCIYRGDMAVKNKGEMTMYFVA